MARYRYSWLLFTSEDRLCANLRVQWQSTYMTSQFQYFAFTWPQELNTQVNIGPSCEPMYINSWRSTTLCWLSPASRLQRGSNLISQDYQLKSLWYNNSATYNHLSLTSVQQYTSVYVSKNVLFPHFTSKLGYLAPATSAPAVSAGCDWNESDYSNNRRKCTEDVNFKLRCQINRFVLFTVSTVTYRHVLLHFFYYKCTIECLYDGNIGGDFQMVSVHFSVEHLHW